MIAEFGSHGSADLELESTIVFVDREAARKPEQLSINELASRVKQVKPRFAESYIAEKAVELSAKGMLTASALSPAVS